MVLKVNTPEFIKINRSQNSKGTDIEQDIVEYTGNNFYLSTSGNCFINVMNF